MLHDAISRIAPALGLGLVLLTAPGAAPVLAQALDAPCANAPNNVAYKDCLNRLSAQADQELDQVWKRVVEKIEHADYPGPKQRKAWEKELSDAQRDWLSFRQKDCGAVLYEYWGGSGAGGFMMLCQLKHTRDRIKHLRARYDISGTAETPSYPFLGRWATKPEGQTQSLSEICKQQSFGHLEITASKVMAYESDCDIKSIEKDGKKFHIQSACFAEGEDFSEIMTIEMRDDGKMHVVERIPKWGQKTTQIYRRCP